MTIPLPNEPKRFGRYTLLHRFASGGMANLYTATLDGTDGFQKTVAVKMMHRHLTDDPEFVKMFIDEARLASRISHPNVVHILELGRIQDNLFMAMEYVEGESVRALLQRTKPDYVSSAHIVACAASGLHAAHELRDLNDQLLEVVHRDVSPDNILISYKGAIKVVDFGVARARDSLHTTSAGSLKGKFSYMAPEQALSNPIDRRVDIFALGIVLYEMTTYRRLFKMPTDAETLRLVIDCKVPPPSSVVDDYPEGLEEIVLTALRCQPTNRYQTSQEFQEALEGFLVRQGKPVFSSSIGKMMTKIFSDQIKEKRKTLYQTLSDHNTAVSQDQPQTEPPSVSISVQQQKWPKLRRAPMLLAAMGLIIALLAGLIYSFAPRTPADATSQSVSDPAPAPLGDAAHFPRRATPKKRSLALHLNDPPTATFAAPHPSKNEPPVPAPATAAKKPPATPEQTVPVRINTVPPTAKILIDGKRVSNPYDVRYPKGDRRLAVAVQAPNHSPERFWLPLETGGTWQIKLQPIVNGVARRSTTTQREGWKKRRRKETLSKRSHLKMKGNQLGDDEVLTNPYLE